jgi:hypothetical protein
VTVADHSNIKDNDLVVCQEHKTPPVKVLSGHSALVQHTTQEKYREFEFHSNVHPTYLQEKRHRAQEHTHTHTHTKMIKFPNQWQNKKQERETSK